MVLIPYHNPPYFLSNNGLSIQSGKIVSVNKGKWALAMIGSFMAKAQFIIYALVAPSLKAGVNTIKNRLWFDPDVDGYFFIATGLNRWQ